jgi:non-homologous end joining protein Ku
VFSSVSNYNQGVSRVRQALVTSADEQPITRTEVLKVYEVEPDRYVVFDQEDLKGLQRRFRTGEDLLGNY